MAAPQLVPHPSLSHGRCQPSHCPLSQGAPWLLQDALPRDQAAAAAVKAHSAMGTMSVEQQVHAELALVLGRPRSWAAPAARQQRG